MTAVEKMTQRMNTFLAEQITLNRLAFLVDNDIDNRFEQLKLKSVYKIENDESTTFSYIQYETFENVFQLNGEEIVIHLFLVSENGTIDEVMLKDTYAIYIDAKGKVTVTFDYEAYEDSAAYQSDYGITALLNQIHYKAFFVEDEALVEELRNETTHY